METSVYIIRIHHAYSDSEDFVQGADAARKSYEDVAQGKAMAEKLLTE